jgi:hypothetical protein
MCFSAETMSTTSEHVFETSAWKRVSWHLCMEITCLFAAYLHRQGEWSQAEYSKTLREQTVKKSINFDAAASYQIDPYEARSFACILRFFERNQNPSAFV